MEDEELKQSMREQLWPFSKVLRKQHIALQAKVEKRVDNEETL
jgi:hypothetical protein